MNGFLRIDTALDEATEALRAVSESPRLDAELLLARALDVPRSYLFAHANDEMDEAAAERFQNTVEKRAEGVPLAYITGEKEFWSMMLMVSPPAASVQADLTDIDGNAIPGTGGLTLEPAARLNDLSLSRLLVRDVNVANATFENSNLTGAFFRDSDVTGGANRLRDPHREGLGPDR